MRRMLMMTSAALMIPALLGAAAPQASPDISGNYTYADGQGIGSVEQTGTHVSLHMTWLPNSDPGPHYLVEATLAGRSVDGTWKCVAHVCQGQTGKFHADVSDDGKQLKISRTDDSGSNGWNRFVLTRKPQSQGAPTFGTTKRTPFSLQGDVYLLEPGTSRLPDFRALKPAGHIYASELNLPQREFSEGFPGVTDRFEWFAIDYHGTFAVEDAGKYRFRLTSDDGAKLYVDDKMLIDNDGVHQPMAQEVSVDLARGVHTIRLPYFQGPRMYIALVLQVAKGDADLHVFNSEAMAPARVTSKDGRIDVSIGDAILFDFNKSSLRPGVDAVLAEIKGAIIDQHPSGHIVVEGHTDDVGSDAYNLALSNERARSVASWLRRAGVAESRMVVRGYGKSRPKVPNTSDANRAKNRRVEISIQP
jgi:outer membrane protein OmpA-like peptidoglycan-associated protein